MPINQLSQSNTFAQWLGATQSLIEKSNFYEETTNLVFETANNVANVYSNTVNVSIEFQQTANDSYNAASNLYIEFQEFANASYNEANTFLIDVQSYVNSAYDTANVVLQISTDSLETAQTSLNVSQQASDLANSFLGQNIYFDYVTANNVVANTVYVVDKLVDNSNRILVIKDENGNVIWGT